MYRLPADPTAELTQLMLSGGECDPLNAHELIQAAVKQQQRPEIEPISTLELLADIAAKACETYEQYENAKRYYMKVCEGRWFASFIDAQNLLSGLDPREPNSITY